MKRFSFTWTIAAALLSPLLPAQSLTFRLWNPLKISRPKEAALVPLWRLGGPALPAGPLQVQVKGKTVPAQADDTDGDGKADQLVLLVDCGPLETLDVRVLGPARGPLPLRTLSIEKRPGKGLRLTRITWKPAPGGARWTTTLYDPLKKGKVLSLSAFLACGGARPLFGVERRKEWAFTGREGMIWSKADAGAARKAGERIRLPFRVRGGRPYAVDRLAFPGEGDPEVLDELALRLSAPLRPLPAKNPSDRELFRAALAHAMAKYRPLAAKNAKKLPGSTDLGRFQWVLGSWIDGFFPGSLFYIYDMTGDPWWKERAIRYSDLIRRFKTLETHDLGFMFMPSVRRAWEETGDPSRLADVLEAARTLYGRYNPRGKYVRAWGKLCNESSAGWTIIDCMMNLNLLYFASLHGAGPGPALAATNHALTTYRNHVRPDGSTIHVVSLDPLDGKVLKAFQRQGFGYTTTWSRGHSWAVHGFAESAAYSKNPKILEAALKVARWFVNHLPPDKVPFWDYDIPTKPNVVRDTSAASIGAAGLLILARNPAVPERDRETFRKTAREIVRSLCLFYLSPPGDTEESILLEGCTHGGVNSIGLNYGDFYFLECLREFLGRKKETGDTGPHREQAALLQKGETLARSWPRTPARKPGDPGYPAVHDYFRVLSRFALHVERCWHGGYKGHSDIGWFGDGRSDENGQRTLANFITTAALLGTSPRYDPRACGIPASLLQAQAIQALRYFYRTHVTGDLPCTGGRKWGNHWQSSWWAGKAALGAMLLWKDLPPDVKEGVKRVLAHEADRLERVKTYGRLHFNTGSEENAWNAEAPAWALRLCDPTPEQAARWRKTLDRFAWNTLSRPGDTGKPGVTAANVYPDFTVENHGFFHMDYMICPLHSLAWSAAAFTLPGPGRRAAPPESLFFNFLPHWRKTRRYILWGGRWAYPGGKDWPRYAYGLYFVLPVLVTAEQKYGDTIARRFEGCRLYDLEREQLINRDGRFFSKRFTGKAVTRWPSEWESDAAVNLSVAVLLHLGFKDQPLPAVKREVMDQALAGSWKSPYTSHAAVRGKNRFASYAFDAFRYPMQGVFAVPGGEDLLEWDGNLCPAGEKAEVTREALETFKGGFWAACEAREGTVPPKSCPLSLEVSDEGARGDAILLPSHPLFRGVPSLKGLVVFDRILKAGPGWTPLARDDKGNPMILEAKPGKGDFLLLQCDAAEKCWRKRPLGRIFTNALAWLGWKKGDKVALYSGEPHAERALKALGISFVRIQPGKLPPKKVSLFVIGRSAFGVRPYWGDILRWVEKGGKLLKLTVQDHGWNPWILSTETRPALLHRLAAVALPDDATFLLLHQVESNREGGSLVQGINFRVENDILNGNKRRFTPFLPPMPPLTVPGAGGTERRIPLHARAVIAGNLVALDALSSDGTTLYLWDESLRRDRSRSLCAETLYLPLKLEPGKPVRYAAALGSLPAGGPPRVLEVEKTPGGMRALVKSGTGPLYQVYFTWKDGNLQVKVSEVRKG